MRALCACGTLLRRRSTRGITAIDASGTISDLPTFLGHNPLVVPRQSPPRSKHHEDYSQWRNMAGLPTFPDAVSVMLQCIRILSADSFVPLAQFVSTPETGGLTLTGDRKITDVPHVHLANLAAVDFEKVWALLDYTLEFARGTRARPEREVFRREGRMIWTSVGHEGEAFDSHLPKSAGDLQSSRKFFYLQVETEGLFYFVMINSLFSLMLEDEPSNHWHSILIPKSYLGE